MKLKVGHIFAVLIIFLQLNTITYAYENVSKFEEMKNKALKGDPDAQFNLGAMYFWGEVVDEDMSKVLHWYKKAAEQGQTNAQYNLGDMYRLGEFFPPNGKLAIYWYEKVSAFKELGDMYATGQAVKENYASAIFWYKKAALKGDSFVQFTLARIYHQGRTSVKQDYKEAFKWYKKSATLGHSKSYSYLGDFYQFGLGIEKDIKSAVFWYRKASQKGDVFAQDALASLYFIGNGVPQNYTLAFNWSKQAALKGNEASLYRISEMYLDGKGIKLDRTVGFKLLKQLADQGRSKIIPIVQSMVGTHFQVGRGTMRDIELAHVYFNVSASNGYKPAIQSREKLEQRMNLDQIQKAQNLAEIYFNSKRNNGLNLIELGMFLQKSYENIQKPIQIFNCIYIGKRTKLGVKRANQLLTHVSFEFSTREIEQQLSNSKDWITVQRDKIIYKNYWKENCKDLH